MCGIIGLLLADPDQFVNQLLFDGLTVLQHRGQDAAGIVTAEQSLRLHLRKDNGLVKDVFQQHHMLELRGNAGIGHCRYPTAGTSSCAEAQPLYTNYPFGICVAHNGNITNTEQLTKQLRETVGRHCNTLSDSELLLNLFAEYLTQETLAKKNAVSFQNDEMKEAIFSAMEKLMSSCHGGYAGLYLINGFGLVGFRDPHGIRPLVFGCRKSNSLKMNEEFLVDVVDTDGIPSTPASMASVHSTLDYVISSESVAIDTLGFQLVRDVRAGEAIFIDMDGNCHSRVVYNNGPITLSPCIFEYVYFARPDSIMDGVSVYESRLKMGEKLAEKLLKQYPNHDIDVVIPIPDTSRTSALQMAYKLGRPFREGFIKNRYIARTFIMPGQATRKKSVRLKLNTIKSEFLGKNVLLVDDSIVRGTTAKEIVQMARDSGARKVYFSSAAPPVRYPNIYGIDIPTQHELIAFERNEHEIAKAIGSDWVLYQDLNDLEECIREVSRKTLNSTSATHNQNLLEKFDTSCFSGIYVTGQQIGDNYFERLHNLRNDAAKNKRDRGGDDLGDEPNQKCQRPTESPNDNTGLASPSKKYQKQEPAHLRSSGTSISNSFGVGCEILLNETIHTADGNVCEPILNNNSTSCKL